MDYHSKFRSGLTVLSAKAARLNRLLERYVKNNAGENDAPQLVPVPVKPETMIRRRRNAARF